MGSDIQDVILESLGITFPLKSAIVGEVRDIKYLGYVGVKTDKGNVLKVDWPEKSFMEMTGGSVTIGMKLEIKKNRNSEKWEVVRIIK